MGFVDFRAANVVCDSTNQTLYLCIAGALYLVMSGGGLAWIQDLFLQKVNRSLCVHL